MADALLIVFSLIALFCGMGVIFSRRVIGSAFSLILAMFSIASIFVLVGSPFLAAIQVLVYAGAIVVLFVFVVMLLDQDSHREVPLQKWRLFLAGGLAFFMAMTVLRGLRAIVPTTDSKTAPIKMLDVAFGLFGEYLWPFEILTVFLVMAIAAVVVLARPKESS